MRRTTVVVSALTILATTGLGARSSSAAPPPLAFHAPVVLPGSSGAHGGGGGNEPSVAISLTDTAIAPAGVRYPSWQSPGEFASSTDGVHFTNLGFPDEEAVGDETNAVDAAGALYNGQICGGATTLHSCLYKSVDGGHTWTKTNATADNHPGAADRPWIDVYPKFGADWDTDQTTVYLEYHTFSPEELAYVTVSNDGGHTFSPPRFITTDTNALNGSGCNTVPGGVAVDQPTGTVYALWISGNDVASNVQTGCNYSQVGPFNKAWVSTSTDGGDTWESHLAWQGAFDPVTKVGDNADKIFATLAVDRGGQVHVLLPVRHHDDPVSFAATGQETPQRTDLLMVTSPDQGATWTEPLRINRTAGSYFFPWPAAGSAGIVDVAYYQTASLEPNDPADRWFIGFSQVRGAVATTGAGGTRYGAAPRIESRLLDPQPVHVGGICTFGLFCAALPGSNRNLADAIGMDLDPAGGANAAYTVDARGEVQVTGHAHTRYPTGLVHVLASVSDPVDGADPTGGIRYKDLRTNPPGPAAQGFSCTGQPSSDEILTGDTVQVDGTVTCDTLAGVATFVLVVTEGGASDRYDMTLFDSNGARLYEWDDQTTAGLGDLSVVVKGQVSDREDSHVEFACQSSGPSAYASLPPLSGCYRASG